MREVFESSFLDVNGNRLSNYYETIVVIGKEVRMPSQSVSDAVDGKSSDGGLPAPHSHDYMICLLGEWLHSEATTSKNASSLRAVHEIAADFESPIVQVSCGSRWSCLLCEDGQGYSFGDNTYGQLGQGHDRPHVAMPAPLFTRMCFRSQRRIVRLSCGSDHGGFVLDVGELYMFGCGSYGRLGTGSESNSNMPVIVRMKWSRLEATAAVAALGPMNHRKLQTTAVTNEDDDDVRFTDISCGDRHTLALAAQTAKAISDPRRAIPKSKTSIVSFGDGTNGRLGIGDEKDRYEGTLISTWFGAFHGLGDGIVGTNGQIPPPTITAICAGSAHNLALSVAGEVFSWGNGVDGQLGHGIVRSEWIPRQLAFFKNLSMIAVRCGASHSVAVSRTGVVYTWGQGVEGQLGLDLEADCNAVSIPHPVDILRNSAHRITARTIVAKHNSSLILDDRDRVFVWGDNAHEQLGFPLCTNTNIGTKSFVPTPRLLANTNKEPSSLSRASRLRELVASAKADPIRLGLAHMDSGGRFTMLVFATKAGFRVPSNAIDREIQVTSPQSCSNAESAVGTWTFTLSSDLSMSAIPSRESAYYDFMTKYKVHLPPTLLKSRDYNKENDDAMDRGRERRSPRYRHHTGSLTNKRGSSVSSISSISSESRNVGNGTKPSSPVHVQHLKAPLKTRPMGLASIAATSSVKEQETRSPLRTQASKKNVANSLASVKPQRPQNVSGLVINEDNGPLASSSKQVTNSSTHSDTRRPLRRRFARFTG